MVSLPQLEIPYAYAVVFGAVLLDVMALPWIAVPVLLLRVVLLPRASSLWGSLLALRPSPRQWAIHCGISWAAMKDRASSPS